jgi:hypothetical protein
MDEKNSLEEKRDQRVRIPAGGRSRARQSGPGMVNPRRDFDRFFPDGRRYDRGAARHTRPVERRNWFLREALNER